MSEPPPAGVEVPGPGGGPSADAGAVPPVGPSAGAPAAPADAPAPAEGAATGTAPTPAGPGYARPRAQVAWGYPAGSEPPAGAYPPGYPAASEPPAGAYPPAYPGGSEPPAAAYPPGYPPGNEPPYAPYPAGYPGAAIHMPSYAAPPPTRSAAASAIGTLGIIFGALVTLGGALQVGCRALVQSIQVPTARDPEILRLLQLEMGLWGLMALMSIALIVIGIGVWRHREMARKAMLVWSILALCVIGGRMATQALVMQPAAAKYQREMLERQGSGGPASEQVLRFGRAWAVYGDLLIWAPYPIVALVLLSRARVRDRCS